MKNTQGLTLIELVVYLVILSIILSIGVPSYKIIRNVMFSIDVRNLITDIRNVRDYTIINGSVYKIFFEDTGYKIVDGSGDIIKQYEFRSRLVFEDKELNRGSSIVNYMSYGINGNANESGTLIICDGGSIKKKISIVPVTGRVLLTDL